MLRKILRHIKGIAILMCLIGFISLRGKATGEPELLKMRATAYCLDGITASGKEVRKGICATGNKELIGKTCILYQRLPNGKVGKLIGIYEIEDTGCNKYVVDVWFPDLEECQCFMDKVYEDKCDGKVYAQIVEAKG